MTSAAPPNNSVTPDVPTSRVNATAAFPAPGSPAAVASPPVNLTGRQTVVATLNSAFVAATATNSTLTPVSLSESSRPGTSVEASVSAPFSSLDPGPCGWTSTHVESALAPAKAADTATAPDLSDPPVAVAVSGALDLEAIISALEADWAAQGVAIDPLAIPPAVNVAPFISTPIGGAA